jgi:uncharacterized protein YegL
MKGNKIEALNNAIRETIPVMQQAAKTNPEAQVLVRAITFHNSAQWHIAKPVPVEQFRWQNVTATGETHLGDALKLATEALRMPPMEKRALPPVLALVTDGQPTDDWQSGLKGLLQEEWGKGSTRLAVVIGRDADDHVLQQFTSKERIFSVANAAGLVECIEWVSRSVGKGEQPLISAGPKIENWTPDMEFRLRHEIVDANGNTQRVVQAGLSGEKEPAWPANTGEEIVDGTIRWQNQGKVWW